MSLNWKRETIYCPGTVLTVPVYGLKDLKAFYAGGDKVISGDRASGRVALMTLAEFSNGRPITVAVRPETDHEGKEWLKRARQQIGRRYNPIFRDVDVFVDAIVGGRRPAFVRHALSGGLALAAGLLGVGAPPSRV